MSRPARLVMVLGLLLAAVSFSGCAQESVPAGYRAVDTRTQAAEAVASGVIAAAAQREPVDIEHYLPGEGFSDQRAQLLQSVPATFSADSLRYDVEFRSDPETRGTVVALVNAWEDSRIFEVTLRWDPKASRSVWRGDGSVDVAGDWGVVSVSSPAGQ